MMTYQSEGDVAILSLDDGKANAIGHNYVDALNEGLDKALRDAQAVLITGRPQMFSAGFDLKEFEKGPQATTALVNKGGHMLLRVFTHPQPVVIACAGHAIAAGALLLLAADTRIGATGEFKVGLNETAIGLSLPVFGLQLASARLSKRHQTTSVIQSQLYGPEEARDAGFFDVVVAPEWLTEEALSKAQDLAKLPAKAYAANKLAVREPYITAIQTSLER